MELGHAILDCHGKDIAIKGSKVRRNVLVVLPMQLCVNRAQVQSASVSSTNTSEGAESAGLRVGSLRKVGTRAPEFVLQAGDGSGRELVLPGRFVSLKSKLFAMDIPTGSGGKSSGGGSSGGGNNLLAEFYDRALVFNRPDPAQLEAWSTYAASVCDSVADTEAEAAESLAPSQLSLSQAQSGTGPSWLPHQGCSSRAEQSRTGRGTASLKRSRSLTSASGESGAGVFSRTASASSMQRAESQASDWGADPLAAEGAGSDDEEAPDSAAPAAAVPSRRSLGRASKAKRMRYVEEEEDFDDDSFAADGAQSSENEGGGDHDDEDDDSLYGSVQDRRGGRGRQGGGKKGKAASRRATRVSESGRHAEAVVDLLSSGDEA